MWPRALCGHIRKHHVRPTFAQPRLKQRRGAVVHEIELEEIYAGNGLDGQDVDGDDLALSLRRPNSCRRYLRPATRCRTEVDYALVRLEQAVPVIDSMSL